MSHRATRLTLAMAAFAILSFTAVTPAAHAQTSIYDTFRNGNEFDGDGEGILAGPDYGGGSAYSQAVQFTAGATATGSLTLSLALNNNGTGDVTVGLYEDINDTPALTSQLMSATRSDVSSAGVYTFSSAAPVTLNAGSKYWVYASATNSYVGLWYSNYSLPFTNKFFEYRDGSVNQQSASKAAFSVVSLNANAAAAPEPGSIALLLTAGVPVVGILCRRKKR